MPLNADLIYSVAYLGRPTSDCSTVYCDPLTGLVAYPSFEQYVIRNLDRLALLGLNLAIGDVDDLKLYVTDRRREDPCMFGHLAGNDCMKRLGAATLTWAEQAIADWPFSMCATFGGDEVIVAAAGQSPGTFTSCISQLVEQLSITVPRTCSFALGSLHLASPIADASAVYRQFVSQVDRALFDDKARIRREGKAPKGAMLDIGTILL